MTNIDNIYVSKVMASKITRHNLKKELLDTANILIAYDNLTSGLNNNYSLIMVMDDSLCYKYEHYYNRECGIHRIPYKYGFLTFQRLKGIFGTEIIFRLIMGDRCIYFEFTDDVYNKDNMIKLGDL